MTKRPSLGKGLEALLGIQPTDLVSLDAQAEITPYRELELTQIVHNPSQPRRTFDDESLQELAESVKAKGVVQPVLVRPVETGYELVAGERRWRAAQLAGVSTIPAIVKQVDDADALVIALIENLHRADLSTLEEAQALDRLYREFGYKQGEIGSAIGKSRPAVNNLIRLLSLDDAILDLLQQGQLEEGHARALLGLADETRRMGLAREAVKRKLTVRQLEARVKDLNDPNATKKPPELDPDLLHLQRELTDALGVLVRIRESTRGKSGILSVHYKSLEKLQEVINQLLKG